MTTSSSNTNITIATTGGVAVGGGGGGSTVQQLPRYATDEERKKALLKVLAAVKRGTLPKGLHIEYQTGSRLKVTGDFGESFSAQAHGGTARERTQYAIEQGVKVLAWFDKNFGPAMRKDSKRFRRIVKTRYIGAHTVKVPVDSLIRNYRLVEVMVAVEHEHKQVTSFGSKDGNGHMIWYCRSCNRNLTIAERREQGLIPPKK